MKLPVKGAAWAVAMIGATALVPAASAATTMRVDALATVDAQGHVHQIVTRQRLTPQLGKALREDLDGWVRGPAHRDGRSRWSQAVFHLALETTPLVNGRASAHFRLLSVEPASYDDRSIAARWGANHRPLAMPRAVAPPPASYVAKAGGTELQ